MVDRQVNRMMATDVNDDGMLTMKEFSLGMPDPRGKVNQDGFTKRQLRYFQQYEPGPDGAVSESKIRDFFTSSRRKYFEIDVLTRRVIRQLDRNQDGGLDLNEYARWITDDGRVTEAVETSFKKEFSRYKGKLTRRSFRNHLVTLDSDATKSFRQRLDQIEGQQDESTAED